VNYPVVVCASLGATVFFALSTAFKHRSASTLPPTAGTGGARLARFLTATLWHRWWLAGLLADVGGVALQALALHIGAVSVVQPLLVIALLFSLIINHRTAGTRMSRPELLWGSLLVAALATFLVASGASSPSKTPAAADTGAAVGAAAVAALIAVGCIVVARRLQYGRRGAVIGVAVGIVYAGTAVLIKGATSIAGQRGVVAMLTSWQFPALVGAGALGLMLAQIAFRSGPLHASLPAMATVDPLLSVALGVIIYDEQFLGGPTRILAEGVAVAVFTIAALKLSIFSATQEEARLTPAL
jgi:drug/metabolite transporter (DMT)-like permease